MINWRKKFSCIAFDLCSDTFNYTWDGRSAKMLVGVPNCPKVQGCILFLGEHKTIKASMQKMKIYDNGSHGKGNKIPQICWCNVCFLQQYLDRYNIDWSVWSWRYLIPRRPTSYNQPHLSSSTNTTTTVPSSMTIIIQREAMIQKEATTHREAKTQRWVTRIQNIPSYKFFVYNAYPLPSRRP